MIKKWDSMNKSENKYKNILMIEKLDSMNKSKKIVRMFVNES